MRVRADTVDAGLSWDVQSGTEAIPAVAGSSIGTIAYEATCTHGGVGADICPGHLLMSISFSPCVCDSAAVGVSDWGSPLMGLSSPLWCWHELSNETAALVAHT